MGKEEANAKCIYMHLCNTRFFSQVSDPAVRSSHFTAQPNVSPYALAMTMMDNDDGISHIGWFLS